MAFLMKAAAIKKYFPLYNRARRWLSLVADEEQPVQIVGDSGVQVHLSVDRTGAGRLREEQAGERLGGRGLVGEPDDGRPGPEAVGPAPAPSLPPAVGPTITTMRRDVGSGSGMGRSVRAQTRGS